MRVFCRFHPDIGVNFSMKMAIAVSVLLSILIVQSIQADKWSSIETEHFVIMFAGSERSARNIQKIAEDFYPKVTDDLGYSAKRKITIWFYESKKEFKRASNAPIQDWTAMHIWLYIFKTGVPYNVMYERGFDGSDAGCALHHHWRISSV